LLKERTVATGENKDARVPSVELFKQTLRQFRRVAEPFAAGQTENAGEARGQIERDARIRFVHHRRIRLRNRDAAGDDLLRGTPRRTNAPVRSAWG
jgi:hypothetical protein